MCVGCDKPSYNIFCGEFRHIEYIGNVEAIKAEEVDIDAFGVRLTWITDSLFFAIDPRNEEAFVSVYSLSSNKILYKNLILKGRGPNEYLDAWLIYAYTDNTGTKAWFSVNYMEKLICVNVSESIVCQRFVVEKEVELDVEDKFALFRVFIDSDTSVVLQRLYNNDLISIYNPTSKTTRSIGWLYSQDYNKQDVSDLGADYVYNASKSILVGAMVFFDQINFYPIIEGKPFSISTARNALWYDDVKRVQVNDRPTFYGIVSYDENMLMCTYSSGKNRHELFSKEQNFLHIISWEGELLKIYELDRYLVGHSYDSRTGYLYGIDMETDRILRYKIDL